MFRNMIMLVCGVLLVAPLAAQGDIPTMTVAEALASNDDIREFYDALERTAPEVLDDLANSDGAWTVFAPANGAFDGLDDQYARNTDGFMSLVFDADAFQADAAQMAAYVRYHIVPRVLTDEHLNLQFNEVGTMLPGRSIRFYTSNVDGSQSIGAFQPRVIDSIPASNGVIYVMDDVIVPLNYTINGVELYGSAEMLYPVMTFDPESPRLRLRNVTTTLRLDSNFEFLLAYLNTRPDIIARLESGGYFTMFATTDTYWLNTYGSEQGVFEVLLREYAPDEFNIAARLIDAGIVPGYFEPQALMRYSQAGNPVSLLGWSSFDMISLFTYTEGSFSEILANMTYPLQEPIQALNVIIYPYQGAPMLG